MAIYIKKLLFRAFSFLIGIALALILSELFFRINPEFGYNYNSFRSHSDRQFKVPISVFLRPSALLGYEHIPNFGTFGLVGKINSYGLVGKEHKFHKDKGTFRILVLGDSIAEQGWPCEFLEDYLNSNHSSHSRYSNFEVWNSGVTSYDVRRYALYLKYKGLNYNPDMVIIFFCLNDFNLNLNVYYRTKDGTVGYYFPIREISKRYNVNPFLMKHSCLYRFVILRLDSYLSSEKTDKESDSMETTGEFYLGIIKNICEKNKIPLFAVIFPYLKPLNDYDTEQRNEYLALNKVNKKVKIDYLDLYKYLVEKDIYSLRVNNKDYIHLNREGHRFIAKIIYSFLLDEFFDKKDVYSQKSDAVRCLKGL